MQANTMYLFFREYINPPSITSLPSSQNLLVRLGKSGIAPIVELVKAIFKKRPDNQRNLIFLQVSLSLFHCLCSFSHLIWYQTFLDFDLHCLLVHLWTRIHDVWIFVNQISWIWWTIFFKFDYIQVVYMCSSWLQLAPGLRELSHAEKKLTVI